MELFKHPNPDTRMYLARSTTFDNLQSHSPQMQKVFATAKRLAELGEPAVIQGPTGTGKIHVAISMANASRFKRKAFVEANGGGAPESLFESEWHGRVKNSASGMPEEKLGFFREAEGGILVIDEAETIPLQKQHIFLLPLNGGRVHPVGADRDLIVPFCPLVLTNQDIEDMVRKGLFRQDLWMRMATHVLRLTGLSERRDDILPTFVERYKKECLRLETEEETLTGDLSALLRAYDWPGNCREVAKLARDAAARGLRTAIEEKLLREAPAVPSTAGDGVPSVRGPRPESGSDYWRDMLALDVWDVYLRHGRDLQATIDAVHLKRATVYRLLRRARELLG